MNNQEIVSKLWNLCNVLRDDGITYHQYVTELTYLLFLKMCKEAEREDQIPAEYRTINEFITAMNEEMGNKPVEEAREIVAAYFQEARQELQDKV